MFRRIVLIVLWMLSTWLLAYAVQNLALDSGRFALAMIAWMACMCILAIASIKLKDRSHPIDPGIVSRYAPPMEVGEDYVIRRPSWR